MQPLNLRELDQVRAVAPDTGTVEMRAGTGSGSDGLGTLTGHFSVFDSWYAIDSSFEGRFLERVAPGAFADTMAAHRGSIRVLYDHGQDQSIGNKVLGSIATLREDDVGAYYEVDLFDTSYNRDLLPGLRAGAYGASFRFRVEDDDWEDAPGRSDHNPHGWPERTITRARVFEFGPVTFPANPQATAGVRSLTDRYYEQLRRRDPAEYEQMVARARPLRRPSSRATRAAAELDYYRVRNRVA